MKRRNFIIKTAQTSLALSTLGVYAFKRQINSNEFAQNVLSVSKVPLFFKISLAQWSLHRALRAGNMTNLDFASKSRGFGFEGLEYVNTFFKDKAENMNYLKEMKSRADSEGQQNVLVMIDGEGNLADANISQRLKAIENHYKWVEAANFLGCHAIRVNLAGGVEKTEAIKASLDSLTKLSEFAKVSNINILVENHGGFSSNVKWITEVFYQLKNENCGKLQDFWNFCIKKDKDRNCLVPYDRYKGMQELLPYAKAISAKSYDFDDNGNETTIDYHRVMKMVKEVGYKGFVGVEFEGSKVSEDQGIELTRDLLIRVGKQLS